MKFRKAIKLIFISPFLIFLLIVHSWAATTYYVDATNGDDSWDGLAAEYESGTHGPWKTISKVNKSQASFNPGDIIKFKAGEVWNENTSLLITQSGSDGFPITYTSYGTDYPKLRRGTIVTGWSGPNENGCYTVPCSTCNALWEDDILMKEATTSACLDGSWYLGGGYLYYTPSSSNPSNHVVVRQQGAGIGISANYIIIDGLQFYSQYYSNGYNHDITIRNCLFDNSSGIWLNSTGGNCYNYTIENNLFNRCINNIYLISGDGSTRLWESVIIRNNEMRYWNQTADPNYYNEQVGLADRDGIALQNLKNSIVEHNNIHSSLHDTSGICHWIATGAGAVENIFRFNWIHNIATAGIINGGGDTGTANCEIYGNIINNFGTGSSPPYGGLRLNRAQTSETPSEVYNNTIYNGDIGIYLNSNPNYYIIKNNIVKTMSSYLVRSNQATVANNIIDYNCYAGGDIGAPFYANGGAKNWTDWKTWCSGDANSITSDPLFVNASKGDFRLRSDSPAIKAGVDVGLTRDYYGNTLRSTPSMGAIEFSNYGGVISPRSIGGVHYKPR